ncbi:Protein ORF73 [Yarrowia sp. C11]|nr:Protein ORF73 [Yarrowia sp. E02]KAG5367806.1 Protein ORF73 [Yarrowia sp. C11]
MPLSIDKYKRIYRKNPVPEVADYEAELKLSREEFKNVKFAFLEQENKEKFIRSLTTNDRVLEQSDIDAVAAEAADGKEQLRAEKRKVQEISKEVEELAQEVVAKDEALEGQKQRKEELTASLEDVQKQVSTLQEEQQSHNMSPELAEMMGQSLQDLEMQLEQSKAELEASKEMITQVEEDLVPQLKLDLADKKAETGALQGDLLHATAEADRAVAEREKLKGKYNDKERLILWLKSSLEALEGL